MKLTASARVKTPGGVVTILGHGDQKRPADVPKQPQKGSQCTRRQGIPGGHGRWLHGRWLPGLVVNRFATAAVDCRASIAAVLSLSLSFLPQACVRWSFFSLFLLPKKTTMN